MIALTDAEIQRFWSKVGRGADEECWPWDGVRFTTGYGAFRLRCTGNNVGAHRIMCKLVHGVEPETVMHSCDNPRCVNPAHLVPGTPALNTRDAAAKGLMPFGERHGMAKLTADDVREIATLIELGDTYRFIAERYGVDRSTVEAIASGKRWAHITGGPVECPQRETRWRCCQMCGVLVKRTPWQLKHRPQAFCSGDCYQDFRRSTASRKVRASLKEEE